MKVSRQPFQLGVFMAEYGFNTCLLCHSNPSISLCQRCSNHNKPDTTQHHKLFMPILSTGNISLLNMSRFNKGIICKVCHDSIDWLPEPFNVSLNNQQSTDQQNIKKYTPQRSQIVIQHTTYYQHPINQLILNFKSGDMSPLPILVHMIRQLPKPNGCHAHNSVIVPVPTTPARLISRGFNPLSILTAYLSHHWQIPIWHGVKRTDNASSQKSLNRQQRVINIQGAFTVTEVAMKTVTNKRLLLFDDVVTTGSTFRELAHTLDNHTVSLPDLLPFRGYCLAHGNKL